jgi:hypothetical protein
MVGNETEMDERLTVIDILESMLLSMDDVGSNVGSLEMRSVNHLWRQSSVLIKMEK